MARIRTIKPSFFTDEVLADLPPLHRLFFQGLWCHADREGRLEDRPRELKVKILPYDDVNAEEALAGLASRGLIQRYEVDGKRYLSIRTFLKHQVPHHKEVPSVIPAPKVMLASSMTQACVKHDSSMEQPCAKHGAGCDGSESCLGQSCTQEYGREYGTGREQEGNGSGKGAGTGTGTEAAAPPQLILVSPEAARAARPVEEVFNHWKTVLKKPGGAKLNDKREAAVKARLEEGYTVEDLKLAVLGCSLTPHNMGKNDNGQKYDDLELICRNGANVERFMANATSPPAPPRNWARGRVGAEEIDKSKLREGDLSDGF